MREVIKITDIQKEFLEYILSYKKNELEHRIVRAIRGGLDQGEYDKNGYRRGTYNELRTKYLRDFTNRLKFESWRAIH
jgi:hypothetical protein